jgi:formylglycine-generating enzyme required for sulfatase activity/dienelactone hydrolase
MATVYLGRDLRHERPVAIKVLHSDIAAALGTERFLREIRIAARLTHPHILPLHDSGEVRLRSSDPATREPDGRSLLYYVMPYVEGESLRDRLSREKQLPVDEALRITREVGDALKYAHTHDVVHRDIKPENILLEAGHAVVADFGIARAIGEAGADHITRTGVVVGTPAYMSPEQALGGTTVDGRSDLYALACVLYEMLAGQPPYTGPTVESVVRQHVTADVPNVMQMRPAVPPELASALTRALSKTPADRFADTQQFADALTAPGSAAPAPAVATTPRPDAPARAPHANGHREPTRPWQRPLVIAGLTLLVLGISAAAFTRTARVLWARARTIPSLQFRVASGDWETAYRLAKRLESYLPGDSGVAELRSTFADAVRIEGSPPGARIYRRAYSADGSWEFLGVAPLARVILPRYPVVSQLRFEAPRYATGFDVAAATAHSGYGSPTVRFALMPDSAVVDGMILVPGGQVITGMPKIDPSESARIVDFYLGRLEVTNREYQVFVDSGGYQRRDLWTEDFLLDGRRLSWEEAMRRFVDQTGRPGPSTWEAGRYAPDRGDHPVGGVSWFEAMAYARFRGARLPNVFQWARAARFAATGSIVTASNIERVRGGTVPVGSFPGMSGSGALDMAGNAREWVVNESKSAGGRYILGGGWSDPSYAFYESAIHPPLDRSATNGIRLARPVDEAAASDDADRPIEPIFRDYRLERPVPDETFRFYRRLFAYDALPLNARVEQRDSTARWIREKVSYAAAYSGERIIAHIFLPVDARPPYQTVVFFPGSTALRAHSSDSLLSVSMFDYLVDGGRAVVYPVYKGTYERDDGMETSDPDTTNRYREHVIAWQQDARRTLDYLISRPDIDSARVGYLGFSWGGRLAGVMLSMEPRFKAAVLSVAGLNARRAQPEVDDLNYMPRVNVPVLMLNGRHDNTFPLETAARPMFDLLGTPAAEKRFVVVEGVHYVPRNALIRETLEWFDRHLGAVR